VSPAKRVTMTRGRSLATPAAAAALTLAHAGLAFAYPGPNGRIAFTSTQDGGARHVFVTTSGGAVDLTGARSTAAETQPKFSPDGNEIALVRDGQIVVMAADGGGRTQLTRTRTGNGDPTWSPDGRSIAFVSLRDGSPNVFVMRADGTGVHQVTHDATGKSELAWSPAGARIAFVRVPVGGGDREIYSVATDGTGLRDLSSDPAAYDVDPAWSPDGTMLAYAGPGHPHGSVGGDLWVMNADGSGRRPLEHERNGYSDGAYPAWSPDGTTIAFTANDGTGYYHVWSVPAAGGENTELVVNRVAGGNPVDQEVDWQAGPRHVAAPRTRLGRASVHGRRASFRFTAGGLVRGYECALRRGHGRARFAACRSPRSYARLRPGRYTFQVRALGPGGRDRSPATRRFMIGGG
jgi:WD40-like Beta Propeller Repeat